MSSEHNHTKNSHKPSGIAKFFLGFSLGILICVLVIFVVKNSSFFQKIESIDLFQNEEMCIEVEDTGEGMTEKEFDSMRRKMKNASIELLENEKGVIS